MPALDGTVPVVEVDHVAVLVAHHLHLNVARPLDEPLDEDGAVAKGLIKVSLIELIPLQMFQIDTFLVLKASIDILIDILIILPYYYIYLDNDIMSICLPMTFIRSR